MTGLARRQVTRLLQDVVVKGPNPSYVVIDDGQSIGDLTHVVTGVEVGPGKSIDGVYRFRISDYAGAGSRLVSLIETAVTDATWIIIHAGGTQCPPALLELMSYVSNQHFRSPRFVLVVERLDLECASSELRELFKLGQIVDLTINRDGAYFLELVCPLGAPPTVTEMLVRLHLQMLESAVPAHLQSLRTLARACETGASVDLETTVDVNYLAGLDPASADYAVVRRVIEEVFSDGAA